MKTNILFLISFFSLTFGWGQTALPVTRTAWNTTPTGWTDTGTVDRSSIFACSGNNAETFDTTADRIVLWFTGTPTQLTFKLKSATMSGESSVLVEQSVDGITYTSLETYGTAIIATPFIDCTDIVLALNATTRYIRWTYTKDGGNCDIDDVNVGSATAVNSITTTPNYYSPFCVGSSTTERAFIPYTISGTFNPGNVFTAQISDSSGNFTSPINIGTLAQVTAGIITATVPSALTLGLGYKFRVVSSNPVIIGTPNPTVFTVLIFKAPTGLGVTCGNATTSITWNYVACYNQFLVVVSTSPFSSVLPVGDGLAYTASPVFGAGSAFDGGFVVYQAQSNFSGPITGLTNGTTYYTKIYCRRTLTWVAGSTVSCTPVSPYAVASDLVYVAGSASTTGVSSISNDAVLTSTTGVQVMNLTVRDGGGTVDFDTVPTLLTGFTITQSSNNNVGVWTDAIQAISLFDGATKLADGVVSATSIVFSGFTASTITDGGTKTLSLRLSLKCPLGGSVVDGQDFGFSITKANTVFSVAGSGSDSSFPAVVNLNNTNIISVIATKLIFTSQPVSTGVNTAMTNIVVKAIDECGNIDNAINSFISLTSTGTMIGQPVVIAATAGIATYSGIIHSVIATNLTLTAAATGLGNVISTNFDIGAVTELGKGDLAILAVNTTATSGGDEFSFVCFKDILSGTQLYFTDNGYEREFVGLWGDSEGVFSITRNGGTLLKGTVMTIKSMSGGINNPSAFTITVCGINDDANWTKSVIGSGAFDLNKDDQIWIMQGGAWTNLTDTPLNTHNASYSGNVLYGWTDIAWKTAPAWPPLASGDTRSKGSTIFPGNRCYSTDVVNPDTGTARVKFNDPIDPDFSTSTRDKIDWIAVINDPNNWNYYTTNALFDAGGYSYPTVTTCPTLLINGGAFISGAWTGLKDTNWFNCNNWDTLEVPTASTNVTLTTTKSLKNAAIISTATDADILGGIAKCNNLTIGNKKLLLQGSSNNKLEINGNLIINSSGALDMDDLVIGNPDGQIYLKGNWDNQNTETSFIEGEGTVNLNGTVLQDVKTSGTPESFYNLTINNPSSFTTNDFHNDVIAKGNLELKNGADLLVKTTHFAQASKNLTIGIGSVLELEDDATLYQSDDSGVVANNGTTIVNKKSTPYVQYDYTFWSSPINYETFGSVLAANPANYIFSHTAANFLDLFSVSASGGTGFPQISGTPDTFDDSGNDWINALGSDRMFPAKGYVAMGNTANGPTGQSVVFTETGANGALNNGLNSIAVTKDKYNADVLTSANSFHTNSNLIGNPYASAIDLVKLTTDNSLLTGTYYFWTHKTPISVATPGPWLYNFTNNDYVTFTVGTGGSNGSCTGCPLPDRYVDSCQSFFANVNGNGNVTFNNSQRVSGNNASFYRSSSIVDDKIWLNFSASNGETRQILVGFVAGAEDEYNPYYDGARMENGTGFDFYSYIPSDPQQRLAVQGLSSFNFDKTVPIGLEITENGTHKISIDHTEGVFNTGQNIYLQDNLTNTIHDFVDGEYVFTSEVGDTINNRFLLRFTNPSLGISENEMNQNNINIFSNNDKTTIKSKFQKIEKIMVFDIIGRELLVKENLKTLDYSFSNLNWNKQALIVKIILENGTIVSKKTIN